ncbi:MULTISPECIES: signal peptidase I [Kitasatospora]|uniref:Signal peptidase I n=1 Tax=Kitasatospora setae (strain ATCC 33774 / DSM 43861 / JCM 3304 / KCC A-0304 / NBRC 14216 / KM-6054) TaxID=452652 RepID=E4N133_KITSK|nr:MULTISPECIES: signal peptidase I [Kitasatospora]BAJ31867.1 putative peptidase S26A family protein [Kitasatospora setae KM-6054]
MGRWSGLGKAALALLILGLLLPLGGVGYALALQPRTFTLSAGNMAPTYQPGQRLLTYGVDSRDVRRGDVVVFTATTQEDPVPGPHFGRVIGLGGDRVAQCGDQPVQLNGAPLNEPYLYGGEPNGVRCFDTTVPSGQMFVMGDHRANSMDSRLRGTYPVTSVVSRDAAHHGALLTIGTLFLVGLPLLPVSLLLALLARRRRNKTGPQPAGYPEWVMNGPPPAGS